METIISYIISKDELLLTLSHLRDMTRNFRSRLGGGLGWSRLASKSLRKMLHAGLWGLEGRERRSKLEAAEESVSREFMGFRSERRTNLDAGFLVFKESPREFPCRRDWCESRGS